MKKTKKFSYKYLAIAVCLSLFVVMGVKAADGGFFDRVAQIAGQVLGQNLSDKVDVEQLIGAMPGNELQGPEFKVNGYNSVFYSAGMNIATTTLCVITPRDRGNATSSTDKFTIQISVGTTTAATLVIATSTSAYSTSSAPFVTAVTVASGARIDFSWTPAVGTNSVSLAPAGIFGPNEYILVKTEGAGLGGYTYTGKCNAKFTQFK